MARVINPETGRKERDRYVKGIVKALRQLMLREQVDDKSRDLASFIALALYKINETIDVSVDAWEKRGYWLKADRYRMEWDWSLLLGKDLHLAILKEDWDHIAAISVKIAQKLYQVKLPQRDRIGEPWIDAWQKLKSRPIDSE